MSLDFLREVFPGYYAGGYAIQPVEVAVGANAAAAIENDQDQRFGFEAYAQLMVATDGLNLDFRQIYVAGEPMLSGDPVRFDYLAGYFNATTDRGWQPHEWDTPLLMLPGRQMQQVVEDSSGSTNTVIGWIEGRRLEHVSSPWVRRWANRRIRRGPARLYGVSDAVGANTTGQLQIVAPSDRGLAIQAVAGHATDPDAAWIEELLVGDDLKLNFGPGAQRRRLRFDLWAGLMGTAAAAAQAHDWHVLPAEILLERGEVLTIALRDTSGSTNTVELNVAAQELLVE
jgi:hypothetical protein